MNEWKKSVCAESVKSVFIVCKTTIQNFCSAGGCSSMKRMVMMIMCLIHSQLFRY